MKIVVHQVHENCCAHIPTCKCHTKYMKILLSCMVIPHFVSFINSIKSVCDIM